MEPAKDCLISAALIEIANCYQGIISLRVHRERSEDANNKAQVIFARPGRYNKFGNWKTSLSAEAMNARLRVSGAGSPMGDPTDMCLHFEASL